MVPLLSEALFIMLQVAHTQYLRLAYLYFYVLWSYKLPGGEQVLLPSALCAAQTPPSLCFCRMTMRNCCAFDGVQSVKDMPMVQDGPPPGGFPSIRYARRLPSTGPTGFTLFAVGAAVMAFGFYRVNDRSTTLCCHSHIWIIKEVLLMCSLRKSVVLDGIADVLLGSGCSVSA